MSVEQFLFLLSGTKLSQNDKKWFPKWIRRYGSCNPLVNGRLPISEEQLIEFSRELKARPGGPG